MESHSRASRTGWQVGSSAQVPVAASGGIVSYASCWDDDADPVDIVDGDADDGEVTGIANAPPLPDCRISVCAANRSSTRSSLAIFRITYHPSAHKVSITLDHRVSSSIYLKEWAYLLETDKKGSEFLAHRKNGLQLGGEVSEAGDTGYAGTLARIRHTPIQCGQRKSQSCAWVLQHGTLCL